MNRFSSLLVAVAAITTGIAVSQAAMVYEVNFDGAVGSEVTGVTGGTGILTSNATVDGGYMKMTNADTGGVTITPASAANSLNSWSTANGRVINGAMDFFFRPNDNMTSTRFMDAGGDMTLISGGGWQSTLCFEVVGPVTWGTKVNSDYGRIGNLAATPLLAGVTYHAGITFTTNVSNTVTAKVFIVEGNVAIDTTGTTGMTGSAEFVVNADNAGFSAGPFTFGETFGNEPSSPDFDAIRIYDAAPASFAALAVPEPTTMAILGLIPLGLLRRRRAHVA